MGKEMTRAHVDRILIVDDKPANLHLLTNLLTEQGYTVHPASDGELALQFVQLILPDLILLDIKMLGMDGYEVCRRLKADERTHSIPIIFISVLEDEHDKVKGFQADAVDYITKPFQVEEVLARVRTHLRLRELTVQLEHKIRERTEELEEANQRLQEELAERRKVEEALRKGEEEYRRIVDTANEGIWVLGPDTLTTFVNARMAEMLGYSTDEMIGRPVTDFMFEVDVPDHLGRMENRRQGISEFFERRYHRKDGQTVWTLVSATPILDHEHRFQGAFGMHTDISERKQAENTLLESKNYLDEIINSVADPLFVKDRQHRWVLINDALCNFMGHDRNELIGMSDYDFFPKNEADVFWAKDEVVFTSGEENINEEEFTDSRGIVHAIVTKKTLYTDVKGEQFIVGVIRDISERKRSEALIRESEEKYRTLVNNLNIGIYRITGGPHGQIIQANPAMIKMFGHSCPK